MPSPLAQTIPAHAFGTTPGREPHETPTHDVLADPRAAARYDVHGLLGEGGMGIVRACHDRRIGREIAVKSAKPAAGSHGDAEARFLREACVQGQLEHPSIVPVYDLGLGEGGAPYFTMKRVRGMTLEQVVDALRAGTADAARRFTRRKLLGAFASVCHAMDFAHTRGVIHRDLKPSNVMLGDFGEVYVLDWGLAKLVGEAYARLPSEPTPAGASGSGAKTIAGAAMGTPGYMSPEQVRGETPDARSDVYALGAILFELLSLETLHPHETAQIALDSTLAGVDARPSARAPRLDVPPELDAVCVRASQLDAADRYPTVRELVDDVERYLDGDRDLTQRRELAQTHARRAGELAAVALARGPESEEARSSALQEVGRAIALDPANTEAAETLMRLMTSPPSEIPAEARAAMAQGTRESMRQGALFAALTFLLWFAYLPLMLWMGIHSWTTWSIESAAWLVAAGVALRAWRHPPEDGKPPAALWIANVVAISLTYALFGPYCFVPTLAAMGAMLLHIPPARAHRVPAATAYCFAVAGPALLQLAGVLPPSYVFEGNTVRLLPRTLDFPPVPTHVFLLVSCVGLVIAGAVIMARFRNTISKLEAKIHTQAWQLQQLVPRGARPDYASVAREPTVGLR